MWCTNNPNVHIRNFRKRCSLILGCFFSVRILNSTQNSINFVLFFRCSDLFKQNKQKQKEKIDPLMLIRDDVYFNTRMPIQASINQHKSTRAQQESARISTSPIWVNTSPTPVNTSQQESTWVNMIQSDQEMIMFYYSLVGKVW